MCVASQHAPVGPTLTSVATELPIPNFGRNRNNFSIYQNYLMHIACSDLIHRWQCIDRVVMGVNRRFETGPVGRHWMQIFLFAPLDPL
jgi:hypothetical protein